MATQKVLVLDPTSSLPKELTPNLTSAGSADSGKVVALNSSGVLDITLLPAGIGSASMTILASETIASSALVNVWNNSSVANVRNANATDATKPAVGFVLAGVSSGSSATVNFAGQLITGVSGLTIGASVFLSAATSGAVTSTAPSATGNLLQYVGYAVSATEFIFDPSPGIIRG